MRLFSKFVLAFAATLGLALGTAQADVGSLLGSATGTVGTDATTAAASLAQAATEAGTGITTENASDIAAKISALGESILSTDFATRNGQIASQMMNSLLILASQPAITGVNPNLYTSLFSRARSIFGENVLLFQVPTTRPDFEQPTTRRGSDE